MFRCLPPAGVPIRFRDILAGIRSMFSGKCAIDRFTRAITERFGVKHAIAVSSGRAALSLLFAGLQALRPDRTEVLIPAFTSFSVPSAVVNAGLRVALYDLDPETLSPDPASLWSAVNENTLCIVVCHLFGYPADLSGVCDVAEKWGIPIVDDAAQAMDARYHGKYVGTLGTAGIFSLSRGKNITAVDGGIIVTDDDRLAGEIAGLPVGKAGLKEELTLLFKSLVLSVLLHPRCYWLPARLPFLKLGASVFDPVFPLQGFTAFQAGIGGRMLGRLPAITGGRKGRAEGIIARCRMNDRFAFIRKVEGADPVFLRLPILFGGSRPEPESELGIAVSYPAPLNEIPDLKSHLVQDGVYPGARLLAGHLLTLPTHEYVVSSDIEAMASYCEVRG